MVVYYTTILMVYCTASFAQNIGENKLLTSENKLKQNNSFFVFLTFLILSLVAGLRWKVGTDYGQYARGYNQYLLSIREDIATFNEPGINIIAKISSWIYDDYATMFLIASIITIGLSINTISKYSSMFSLSILLFIFIGVWHGSFNGVRQYLACAILFAGHRYILQKNLLKYVLVVFIASIFHTSAIVMVLLYFIPKKIFQIKHLIFLTIGVAIILYSYDFLLGNISNYRYEGKSLEQYQYTVTQVSFARLCVSFAPIIFYYVFTSKRNLNSEEDMFYINLLLVNAAVVIATANSAYLFRFVIFTNIFSVLAYPKLLNQDNRWLVLLFKFIIIIFYSIFWYVEVTKSPELYNYQWIFNRF